MAESGAGIDRGISTTGYTPFVEGDRRGGDRLPRNGMQLGDIAESGQRDLRALIEMGVSKLDAGAEVEATECFRKALELGDRTLGAENPDLILILNDLTRLYLKQSRHADAEPLLLRLLDMKRSKGEDHPEVATVLASLAAVQQALGRHESAEQLWRRVLDIRERTLAPNHFAIATALEHLGDACAARGNIREALPAFQRALMIRERTLGDAHPSVRTSKERIADLQLQAADDSLDPSSGLALPSSPERYRLLSGDQLRLSPAMPTMAPVATIRDTSVAPARDAIQSEPRQMRVVLHIPSDDSAMPDVAAEQPVTRSAADSASVTSYREALESVRDELERPYTRPELGAKANLAVEALMRFFSRRQVVAGTVAVVLILLSLAVAKDHAWGELEQTSGAVTPAVSQPAPDPIPAVTASALATPLRDPAVVALNTAASRTPLPKAAVPKPRVEDHPAPRKSDDASKSDTRKFTVPTLSSSVMSHLDSAVTKAGGAGREETFNLQPTAIAFGTQRSTFGASDASTAPLRARLIGELPTPRIPPQATDVEGEVRVRFSVDAYGQPMMATFTVVTSPHPLLTAAVRRVIPEMRFEPARTGGADPKPISDVVETSFRFSRATR